MKSVSLLTYNLLKLGRKVAEFPEEENLHTSGVTNFPLHHRSKDKLYIVQHNQTQTDPSILLPSEDDDVYRQLLQVVSSSSKCTKFDSLSSDVINRLDKSQGAAPLHYACMNNNLHMTTYLLESGANVDIWDRDKQVTPLICASALNRLEIVKVLLEHNCNVNAGLSSGKGRQYSALHWAVKEKHPLIVDCLLLNMAFQHSYVPFSETPIHTAVICGSREILEMLITAQSNNTTKTDFLMGPEKNSPLHLAASGNYDNSFEICKILLEKGNANVNLLNSKGKTALHLACSSHSAETVQLLLNHFAKINVVDIEGRTPLFNVISNENKALDCMEILFGGEGNCNVNHQDKWGNTALHISGTDNAERAAEILLINGADFSIKNNAGVSALSILHKNISRTSVLLSKAFDQAVTITNCQDAEKQSGPDCKVDFKYVLPSVLNNENLVPFSREKKCSSPSFPRFASIFKFMGDEDGPVERTTLRKETSKIKCLLEEEYSSLLLHPVVHSFLELKWHKLRLFFLPTLAFKVILVILYTFFLQIPYTYNVSSVDGKMDVELYCYDSKNSSNRTNNGTTVIDKIVGDPDKPEGKNLLLLLQGMYWVIATMAAVNAFMDILKIIRAPRQQLKSLHPWISITVWLMIVYNSPETWQFSCDPCRKPVVALGILLAWTDVWLDMSRFPKFGLSIRVFIQVFKNFLLFILPHVCLLIGFTLSLSLMFHENIEFQSVALTLPKLIRLMAGDVELPPEALNATINQFSKDEVVLHHVLTVYIFTAFVLVVGIVLMNLLIGLAVNDLQNIFKDAAMDKLVKQTILMNTLETSFSGCWVGLLRRFFAKRIYLFPGQDDFDKTIAFNPHVSSDSPLNADQKKALLKIGSANRKRQLQTDNVLESNNSLSKRIHRKNAFIRKLRSKTHTDDDEENMLLVEAIDKLKVLLLHLENKMAKS